MYSESQQVLSVNNSITGSRRSAGENKIELLFNRSACKPCSLYGTCNLGNADHHSVTNSGFVGKQTRPFHKGDYLYRQGDKLRNIYVIKTGGVKLLFTSHNGTDQIINFYLRGDILGLGDIEAGVHSCSAIVLETTSVCKLPYDQLQTRCLKEPHLYDQLFRMASREIAYEHNKMVLLGQKQSEERLASFILDLASRNRKNGFSHREFNLSMSRHDIAKYLCLADETISRIITKFCNERLLNVNKRSICICDPEQLAIRAGLETTTGSVALVS